MQINPFSKRLSTLHTLPKKNNDSKTYPFPTVELVQLARNTNITGISGHRNTNITGISGQC
jgi:hypothetical protein